MKNGKAAVEKIAGVLMMSRTYAHMCHLKTSSYSQHMALNDFYDDESDADFDVTEMVDDLVEAAQGMFGKLNIPYVPLSGDINNPAKGLEGHLKTMEKLAMDCEHPMLSNIFQEIQKLYYQTIYKLKHLD